MELLYFFAGGSLWDDILERLVIDSTYQIGLNENCDK